MRARGPSVTLESWLRRRRRVRTLIGAAAAWTVLAAVVWRGVLAEPASVEWARRPARVLEAVDGRTLRIAADGERARVRLLGVALGEDRRRRERARRELAELCEGRVVLSFDRRRWRDERGRLLGYVYTPAGRMINEQLIRRGLARRADEVHELNDWFARLQRRAQIRNRGMWAEE